MSPPQSPVRRRSNKEPSIYQGKRVHFCCADCREEFKKDPEKYIKKLEDQGVAIEKTPDAK